MMKHILKKISLLTLTLVLVGTAAYASILTVPQGGTGAGTITGIIKGNGTGSFTPVTIGTGLSLVGSTLSATGTPTTIPINSLLAATAANTINNVAFQQNWQWNSLAGGHGLDLNAITTAATGNTQTLLNVALNGVNATSNQTTYGASFANGHSGTGSVNFGASFTASAGGTNYSALFNGNIWAYNNVFLRGVADTDVKATGGTRNIVFGSNAGGGVINAATSNSLLFGATNGGFIDTNGSGSFAFGEAFGGEISAGSAASLAWGYAEEADSLILANALGSQAFGDATSEGTIEANVNATGSLVFGTAIDTDSNINTSGAGSESFGSVQEGSIISAASPGSMAFGYGEGAGNIATNDQGGLAFGKVSQAGSISTGNSGSQAFGFSDGGQILTGGSGSFAFGVASTDGQLATSSDAAFAFGDVTGSGSAITGDAIGCLAFGAAHAVGSVIHCQGSGSVAFGTVQDSGGEIRAGDSGSFAGGFSSSGQDIIASGAGSFAFGSDLSTVSDNSVALGQSGEVQGARSFLFAMGGGTTTTTDDQEFSVGANGNILFDVNQTTAVTSFLQQVLMDNLSGSGTRMVTASSTGLLSTTTLPTGTVGSFAFTNGSGFTGTVTNSTTTPTLALTTSLTLGSVAFIGSSGALTQDNTNYFWDNTNKRLGLGINIPVSTLDVAGSFGTKIRTITTSTTVLATDHTVLCDASGGAVTLTLTSAASSTGREYDFKKIDSSANACILQRAGSDTIDAATTQSTTTQYFNYQIQSAGGTAWYIL